MADKGKNVGDMEYGRVPYAGTYIGDMEYGRCPGIGYKYFPVLTVQSMPSSGVSITVSPSDINGQGNGTTEFTRDYEKDTDVSLTAPGTFGELVFSTWKVDGSPIEGNPIVVAMGADHTAVVEYVEPPPPPEVGKGVEMLYVKLPRRKFWTADYPNLDPNAEGRPIPIGWGEIKNIKPVCIDTSQMKFKLMDNYGRAIKSVDQVKSGEDVLSADLDYEVDLANAEITIRGTPVLEANKTYYFVLESDYPINGTDYLRFAQKSFSFYPGGQRYDINEAGIWTPVDADLFFIIYVKDSLGGSPYILIDNGNVDWGGWNMDAHLRDSLARTRLAQSFTTPPTGGPWYLYQIAVDPRINYGGPVGNPPAGRITRGVVFSSSKPAERIRYITGPESDIGGYWRLATAWDGIDRAWRADAPGNLAAAWATNSGDPNITGIQATTKTWVVEHYVWTGYTDDTITWRWRLYKRDSGGTETELQTGTYQTVGTGYQVKYFDVNLSEQLLATSDRLVLKIWHESSSGSGAAEIRTLCGTSRIKFDAAGESTTETRTQIGSKSYRMEDYPLNCNAYFPQRAVGGDISVDLKSVKNADNSLMENVADILNDSYVTIMGGSEGALDAAALAALKAARMEPLSIWLNEEIQYREFLDKLEAGQFFKFLPTLDWKFTTLYAEAGEPSGTIHFRDEDFLSFRCRRLWSSVYQKVKIKYVEDPSTNEWQVREAVSEAAQYCYRVQRTLETETFLKAGSDAQACANEYRELVEAPQRVIEFSVAAGKGFGLIPWQKIKVTRQRADAPGGMLNGVLFRILSIKQNPLTGSMTIEAVLDEQTY